MATQKAVRYLSDSARKYGISATLHDLQCRLVNKLVQFQILRGMTVRVQDVGDRSLFEARGFEARFVGEEDLWRYARESHDRTHGITAEFVGSALARGDRCYALFDGETLAAYGWYSDRPTPLDEHFVLHFGSGWTYMYKGYTMDAYRGKRLHAVGMCGALRALTDEGRKGLISCVESNNFASLHSVTRMGYRIFGDVYLLRIAGRSFAYATKGCRPYAFWVEPLSDAMPPIRRGSAATTRPPAG
jgi:hypothetical protein